MRIIFFDYVCELDKPGESGLSDIVWNIASRLQVYGDDVHIVAPYSVDSKPANHVIVHRFRLPPVGYRNIIGHILIVLAGSREISRLEPADVIHVPEYLSSGILPILHRRTPVVLSVPGNIHHRIRNKASFDWPTDQVFKATSWITARRCARIVATCELMRKWWEVGGTSPSKLVVIPYGFDADVFRPIPGARTLLGIDDKTSVILYVGRLQSRTKGLEFLLRAVHSLASKIDCLQLHIVGSGPDAQHLDAQARDLGIRNMVVFHGWVRQKDLAPYYSAADVTVLPSFAEGQPRTMWEAMACGSAFLGSEGVIDDIVDGETGFLAPPRNAQALAAKLDQVLTHTATRRSVALNGTHFAHQYANWDTVVRRIREEVYEPLASRRPTIG